MLEGIPWQTVIGVFLLGSAISLVVVFVLTRIRVNEIALPTQPLQQFVLRPEPGEWLKLRPEQFDEALRPEANARRVDGWGDYRIRVRDVDVAFLCEGDSVQISFEGAIPADIAARIVDEIRTRIDRVTGQGLHVEAT